MRMTRSKTPIIYNDSQEFQIGKGIILRDGSDCTIAACGITVKIALDAADLLQQDGISCRVIDCFSVKPIDKDLLEKAARETGTIVTCEEHNIMGGFGSSVSEVISESYPVPIRRIGVQDKFGESARDNEIPQLFEKHGITSINIANAVKEAKRTKTMKIFLDTANLDSIRMYNDMGLVDGITTNPSLLAKEGGDPQKTMEEISKIIKGDVSLEVVSTDYDGMMTEGRLLRKYG